MTPTMMPTDLTITSLMQHTDKVHGKSTLRSISSGNRDHKYSYCEGFKRARQLANALAKFGLQPQDCIGTLAWNDHRHFELYYAVSCSGYICHTVNPRLFSEQLEYIINHAEDQWIFIDPDFVPLIEGLIEKLPLIKGIVVLTDAENMPSTTMKNVHCYETLIADESEYFNWPTLDENSSAAICYTSGTTGNPKGVMYTHRSTVLHAMASALPDAFSLSASEVIMPIVPMFHVNAWGWVYSGPMTGADLVLPGRDMGNAKTITQLIAQEKVTLSAAVPAIWMLVLKYLADNNKTLESLNRIIVGGAVCPLSVIEQMEELHNVHTISAWGMTEMSPLGALCSLRPHHYDLPKAERHKLQLKAGVPLYGVEMKIVDDENNELPWDGEAAGSLRVRGPWVCNRYFKQEKSAIEADGWFDTGDISTIDAEGFMMITDRAKDLIKSGGEWISSTELENCAAGHPEIAAAAVIGMPHEKWDERPLLIAVLNESSSLTKQEALAWFESKVAKWWIPNDCIFIDSIPMTATNKISKKDLRIQFVGFKFNA